MLLRNPAYFLLPAVLFSLPCQNSAGQDITDARAAINVLCSQKMHGRGFARGCDKKAAGFVRLDLEASGIKPFGKSFYQFFQIDANTFPGRMNIGIDHHTLVPGVDYLVDPSSPGLNGNFKTLILTTSDLQTTPEDLITERCRGKVLLIDSREAEEANPGKKSPWSGWIERICQANPYGLAAVVEITGDKLNFGTSSRLSVIPHIILSEKAFPGSISTIRIHIGNRFLSDYITQNIAGYIRGTVCPDSFVVFTAHYDHLGLMGRKTFFPGANDNASGVAMLLNLSHYFSVHPQRFSVAFLCFSAEESGLSGSGYFAGNPLFPLSSVKFLVNLDIVGTGIDGIMIVNATEFPGQFARLASVNENGRFVTEIKKRGPACNSDHCPFYENGVSCFFIYTLGGICAYHDVNDRPETLPLTAFDGLTKLLIGFTGRL